MEGFGVYLNSTLNWIASAHEHDDSEITFSELKIVSLDLGMRHTRASSYTAIRYF